MLTVGLAEQPHQRPPHGSHAPTRRAKIIVGMQQSLLPSARTSAASGPVTKNNLGTINGCYIPCLLNILGAPLFLFVGFAVGMLGWPAALALFCFSELIAYLTITSFSALVTNGTLGERAHHRNAC